MYESKGFKVMFLSCDAAKKIENENGWTYPFDTECAQVTDDDYDDNLINEVTLTISYLNSYLDIE